jgi:hypothetical protein
MKFLAVAIRHLIEQGADPLAIQRFVDEIASIGASTFPATPKTDAERAKEYRARCREERHASRDGVTDVTLKEKPPIPPKENNINIYTPVKAKKGSRLPENWQPSLETLSYADKLGCSAAEIASMAEDFRLWAYSASGQVSIKRDWESAFKGWMRREKAKGKVSEGFKPKPRYGQVVQGSFRKEFKPEPEGPKVSEEERQANLAKLAQVRFGAKKL